MPIPKKTQSGGGSFGGRGSSFIKKPAKYELVDRVARITFFDNPEKVFAFNIDDTEHVREPVENYPQGAVFATIDAKNNILYGLRPLNGAFLVQYAGIPAPEGQLPAPKHYEKTGRNSETGEVFTSSYDAFTVLLRVVSGSWAGTILPLFLRYKFEDAGDGEITAVNTYNSSYGEMLAAFLEYAGLDPETDTIPYSPNVLPWIDRTLKERNQTFMAIVQDGYVEGLGPKPDAD